MGNYVAKSITAPILEFIKTCPFLEQYGIDLKPASIQQLVTTKPDGSALDYVGSTLVSDARDLLRKRYTARQANFQLWLLRKSNHNIYRQEIADFLFNFEQWVEYCQAYSLTPKLSETAEGKLEETMFADNGAYVAEWEGQESSLYMVQIHVVYYNNY